jgi:hypothetical protein
LNHAQSEVLSGDGFVLPLANRIVVRNDNREMVAESFGLLHVMQMTCMKEVKHTNSHHALHNLTQFW